MALSKPVMAALAGACALGVSQAFVPNAAPVSASQPASTLRGTQERSVHAGASVASFGAVAISAAALAGLAAGAGLAARRSSGSRADRRVASVSCRAEKDAFAGGLVGGDHAFGAYNFDPLRFSTRYPGSLPWFREAELKHGRIAMLAWVGLVVPDVARIPGPPSCYGAESVVAAHKACVGEMVTNPGPLLQVFLFVGIVEMLTTFPKCVEGLTLENAGDYKLGLNFLPTEPEKAAEMRLKELKNGRLAMIAFGGAITQAVLSGHGFPWLYAERRQGAASVLASSVAPTPVAKMAGRSWRVAMTAEPPTTGGYKMSKAVPFLPVSPALEGYVGGEEEGFDPMGVSLAIDIRWLREAELKHGRVAMLATVGWIATDLGMRVPGPAFQVSTIEAHDAMVKFGAMPQMLVWLGYLELFGFLAIVNMMEGKTDRQPGDFGIRALYPTDPQGQYEMQLKELRNGRLAMLAFGGIVTSAVYTQSTWPFFAVRDPTRSSPFARGSALCGGLQSAAKTCMAVRALETSRSLPFLPKPQNLKGYVGEEQEFDPLGFSDTFDMRWLREAELKHGRVCMLASVGFFAQQYITFPGFTPTPNALDSIYTAAPGGLATLVFLAGYIESSAYGGKLTMLDMFEDTDRAPGDLNFGKKFLPKDEEKAKDLALRELNNGRLAMLGFSGMIHHNLVVKGPLFPLFPEGWTGPQGSWGVEDQSVVGALTQGMIGNESAPDPFFVGRA